MSCWQTISDYAFRSIGYGERLLPRSDITLCEQFTLIASGMIWNVYFGVFALMLGFIFALALAMAKASQARWLRLPASLFIFIFRGSPLFIQFFFAYSLFSVMPRIGVEFSVLGVDFALGTSELTRAWAGALIVLFCNTAAYSAEIFFGAYKTIPRGEIEAAEAYGFFGFARFRRLTMPVMLRLAWPSYTNEAIFLFHATALVFFSGFPARQQRGDALYYANYFADKTFNPFIPYPILAFYFILLTLVVIFLFGLANRQLNRHLPENRRERIRVRPKLIR